MFAPKHENATSLPPHKHNSVGQIALLPRLSSHAG
jgi:hypothetical protein